jgi:TetR/AcrR family transcriptional regulator
LKKNPKESGKQSGDKQALSTEERILTAALAEFAQRGLAGARVDEIARRAKINKQALYYYFGSKDKLFQAALTFGYGQSMSGLDLDDLATQPADAAMRHVIGVIFDHFRQTPYVVEMIAHENHYRGEHLTEDVLAAVREAVAPLRTAIKLVLRRGQKEGLFAKQTDPTQFYLTVFATCMFHFANAFTLSAILGQDLLAETMIAKRRRHLQDVLVGGLRIQPNG